ncbi:hypothetical protein PFAG_05450 [Plasmodium falciparum Santa Lucia]|nr:hypothetical protein PFTANZ_05340 [Plasmodium falciparum Tanzania (2000708)]ETW54015.1 hypothetical protein PFUGPA_03887 [Plasmodium falciparum Palo Alto/Uganda]EUR47261.1 hypothetical protein PFBG_06177 [Plasmodium falciparum 7G8]EUT78874.1 hypothetical protein PFAG_05450 [Plasmodium falciparum Santa Lucia]EWC73849.1 hypothetical protein C923_05480 [Plasmodium falciparum UGT5.1]
MIHLIFYVQISKYLLRFLSYILKKKKNKIEAYNYIEMWFNINTHMLNIRNISQIFYAILFFTFIKNIL